MRETARRPPTAVRRAPRGRRGRRVALPVLVLVALTGAAFFPVLGNGFVWDDRQYIVLNRMVSGGISAASIRAALTSFTAANWHPLTWFSHMLDVSLFGLAPAGHHLINLLLHAANAALLFLLLAAMTGSAARSFAVAALFAVHPLHVESVAWVAERKDLLSTFLGLAAAAAYLSRLRRPSPLRSGAVILLFGLALTAKPMLVTFPFLLLLLDFWPLGRFGRVPLARLLLEKAPLFLLSAASSAVTLAAQAAGGAMSVYPLAVRLSNALASVVRYLLKILWPHPLSPFYPHPERLLPAWQIAATALVVLAATVAVCLRLRRAPFLAVGWLWFLGMLVPVIGIVQVGMQAMADRYTYLPATGIFLLAAWGLPAALRRLPSMEAALPVILAVLLAACSVASAIASYGWKDAITLWRRAAGLYPGSRIATYNLGTALQQAGAAGEAERWFRRAIAIDPAYAEAHNNLGGIYAEQGRYWEAVAEYQAAILADSGYAPAFNNLANLLVKGGKDEEAAFYYREAIRRDPTLVDAHINLGALLTRLGRYDEADRSFESARRASGDAPRVLSLIEQARALRRR